MYFYSPTTKGFYPAEFASNYKEADAWPSDCVEVTLEEHRALIEGQNGETEIAFDATLGKPVLRKRVPPPLEERRAFIERQRRNAYADPQTGSDRLFAEANRMQLTGETGWEELLEKAKARYTEIKETLPWPSEASE
ncbi:putative tail fiber assembly protein [Pseudomonas phage LUZ100]|nr:putative tail fiber assembly protein [Pseudomonas phage LUZ100]